jgi:hypothetical protein
MSVSNKIAIGSTVNRVLLFDECVNNSLIDTLSKKLLNLGLISSCQAVWQKAMEDESGNVVMVGGNPSKEMIEKGARQVKNYSFDDEGVADLVFANTHSSNIIFVSENTKNNIGGIYRLLNDKHKRCQGSHSLLAVFKKGKTPYEKYINSVQSLAANWNTGIKFNIEMV